MKNLNKILSLVLALAMSFSLGISANAAVFPDTQAAGQEVNTAVDMLTGLGIIGGYPDGTYGPDKTITRAEFLKVLFVMVNGTGGVDLYSGSATKYPDVTPDKWFAAYVTWADQSGIVGGYPDGTFKPDDPVKVSEAAKMLVCSLGFVAADYSFPYGFIDKANKLNIFENVTSVGADDAALRKIVALMAYNTLFVDSAPRYKYYDTINKEDNYETPLAAVFGAQSRAADVVATSTYAPALANITKAGQVAFEVYNDALKGFVSTQRLTLDCAINCDGLIARRVELWFIDEENNKNETLNNGDKIIAVLDKSKASFTIGNKDISLAREDLTDTVKYLDLFTVYNGDAYLLFKSFKDSSNTSIGDIVPDTTGKASNKPTDTNPDNWARDKFYRYFNCGDQPTYDSPVPADLWISNYGVKDQAFKQANIRPYNTDNIPWTFNMDSQYTFVDNDSITDNQFDKILLTYSRTSQITDINTDMVVIKGINGDASIPKERLFDTDISSLSKDMYVTVKAKTAIVDDAVEDVYSVAHATVLEGKAISSVSRYNFTIDGTTYMYTQEYFLATPERPTHLNTNPKYASREFLFPTFADAAKPSEVVGGTYDVVLTADGYIFALIPAEPNDAKYLLVSGVALKNANSSLVSPIATITGLTPDGTVQTFEIDTSDDGLTSEFAIDGEKIFNPEVLRDTNYTNDELAWYASLKDGATDQTQATTKDLAARGKLIKYTLNGDGQIKAFSKITAPSTPLYSEYMYEPNSLVLYGKDAQGSYNIDKTLDSSVCFFSYDDHDTADIDDDEYKVTTADKMSSFKDTALAGIGMSDKDSSKTEVILLNGPVTSQNSDVKFVYFTMNTKLDYDPSGTSVTYGVQVLVDGAAKYYYSLPIAIGKNDSYAEVTKKALKAVFDPGPDGAVRAAIEAGSSDPTNGITAMLVSRTGYLALDSSEKISKIYLTNYSKNDAFANNDPTSWTASKAQMIDLNITNAKVNEMKDYAVNKFYRGSVKKVSGSYITVEAVNQYAGRAYTQNTNTMSKLSDSLYSVTRHYTHTNAPAATFKVADSCQITLVNLALSEESTSAVNVQPSGLKPNTDKDNYPVEFMLGYTDDSETTTEIKQLVAYTEPTENSTVTQMSSTLPLVKNVFGSDIIPTYKLVGTDNIVSGGTIDTPIAYTSFIAPASQNTISPKDIKLYTTSGSFALYSSPDFSEASRVTDTSPASLTANVRYTVNGTVVTTSTGYSTFYVKVTDGGKTSYNKLMIKKNLDDPNYDASLKMKSGANQITSSPGNEAGTAEAPKIINYTPTAVVTLPDVFVPSNSGAQIKFYSDYKFTAEITTMTTTQNAYVRVTSANGLVTCCYKLVNANCPFKVAKVFGVDVTCPTGAGTAESPISIAPFTAPDGQLTLAASDFAATQEPANFELFTDSSFSNKVTTSIMMPTTTKYLDGAASDIGYNTYYVKMTGAGLNYYKVLVGKNAETGKNTALKIVAESADVTAVGNQPGTLSSPKIINTEMEEGARTIPVNGATKVFETAEAGASMQFYSDAAFTVPVSTVDTTGGTVNLYVKVTSADTTNVCYYKVVIAKAAIVLTSNVSLVSCGGEALLPNSTNSATAGQTIAEPFLYKTFEPVAMPTMKPSNIIAEDKRATVKVYEDAAFTREITNTSPVYVAGRAAGALNEFYVKVTSSDNSTVRYCKMFVKRTLATTDAANTELTKLCVTTSITYTNTCGTINTPKTVSRVGFADRSGRTWDMEITVPSGATITYYTDATFSEVDTDLSYSLVGVGVEAYTYIKVVAADGLTTTYYIVKIKHN